jgi:hypothetical protein
MRIRFRIQPIIVMRIRIQVTKMMRILADPDATTLVMYGTWVVTSSTGARCGLVADAGAGAGARPVQRPSLRTRPRKLFSTVFTVTSFTGFTPLASHRQKN